MKKTLIFTKLIQMTRIFNIQVFSLKIDKFCKQTSLVCSGWQIVLRTLILYNEFWWNLFDRLILVTPFERHWPIQFHFNQIIPIRRFSLYKSTRPGGQYNAAGSELRRDWSCFKASMGLGWKISHDSIASLQMHLYATSENARFKDFTCG